MCVYTRVYIYIYIYIAHSLDVTCQLFIGTCSDNLCGDKKAELVMNGTFSASPNDL